MELTKQIKILLKKIIPPQIFWMPRYYHLYKRMNFKNEALILDAGCGEALVTMHLAKKKLKIIGMDRSFKKIKEAHLNCKENIFIVADVNNLPFKKEVFGTIFSLDVLEYVDDIKNVWKEFNRVLKPKGELIISVTKDYICSAKLFSIQRKLRKIIPHFLYTHDLPGDRSWLEYSDRQMTEKLGHRRTYCFDDLIESSKDLFKVLHYEYFIKKFSALAYDVAFGVKGFYLLRFFLFFIAVRVDHYFFKKMPGYSLLVEFIKADGDT